MITLIRPRCLFPIGFHIHLSTPQWRFLSLCLLSVWYLYCLHMPVIRLSDQSACTSGTPSPVPGIFHLLCIFCCNKFCNFLLVGENLPPFLPILFTCEVSMFNLSVPVVAAWISLPFVTKSVRFHCSLRALRWISWLFIPMII